MTEPVRPPLLAWGAATDAGRVRSGNEDAYVAEAMVFGVADGMGGHQAGEVASAVHEGVSAVLPGGVVGERGELAFEHAEAAHHAHLAPLCQRHDGPRALRLAVTVPVLSPGVLPRDLAHRRRP